MRHVTATALLALLSFAATQSAHADMPWDAFVIECMETGRNRAECFDALPPDLLAELEAYEAEQREMRRAQVDLRQALNSTEGPVFGQESVLGPTDSSGGRR